MVKKLFSYLDCIALLLVALLYFLVLKDVVPFAVYSVVCAIAILAIVPGKLSSFWKERLENRRGAFVYLLSNLVVALLIVMTGLYLLLSPHTAITVAAIVLRILNICCMLYFIYKSKEKDAIFCLCALLLPTYSAI